MEKLGNKKWYGVVRCKATVGKVRLSSCLEKRLEESYRFDDVIYCMFDPCNLKCTASDFINVLTNANVISAQLSSVETKLAASVSQNSGIIPSCLLEHVNAEASIECGRVLQLPCLIGSSGGKKST